MTVIRPSLLAETKAMPSFQAQANRHTAAVQLFSGIDSFQRQTQTTTQRQVRAPHFGTGGYTGSGRKISYKVTGRKSDKLKGVVFPAYAFDQLTKDMKILDLCAGKGSFVDEMQQDGYTGTFGVDRDQSDSSHVIQRDISQLAENSFQNIDRIFCSWGIFSYPETETFQAECLKKMASWLKSDGKIFLSPVDIHSMYRVISAVPSLQISNYAEESTHHPQSNFTHWVELSKV